jgi:hypothetical protein
METPLKYLDDRVVLCTKYKKILGTLVLESPFNFDPGNKVFFKDWGIEQIDCFGTLYLDDCFIIEQQKNDPEDPLGDSERIHLYPLDTYIPHLRNATGAEKSLDILGKID